MPESMKKNAMNTYYQISFLAAQQALYNRLLDEFWEEFQRILEEPEVKAAGQALARAIAKSLAPKPEEGASPKAL